MASKLSRSDVTRSRKWALAEMGYSDLLLECARLQREVDRLRERVRELEGRDGRVG